jgi:hypothetical protein
MNDEIDKVINNYKEESEDLIVDDYDLSKKDGYKLKFKIDAVEMTYDISIEFKTGKNEEYKFTSISEDKKTKNITQKFNNISECLKTLLKPYLDQRDKFMKEVNIIIKK